jgi:hypothetical protein
MSDIGLVAILVVAFVLAIGLVRALGRLIDADGPDDWIDEPPDTAGTPVPSVDAQDGAR